MQVIFESSDPQANQLRTLTERRVRQALKRFTWLTPRVHVHLSDINGPRGGVDKRCKVELKTTHSGTVVITAIAHDWRSALDNALARAARVLVRSWQRGQSNTAPHGRAFATDFER